MKISNNPLIIADKNFTAEYTVVVKLWDKSNIKAFNWYNNLGLKMADQDECFEFEKTFEDIQTAIAFFLVQQEVYEVECLIVCEYSYDGKIVASEYVESIDVAFRAIADKRYSSYIKSKDATIEALEAQLEKVKPILNLPAKEIDYILQYVKNYNERQNKAG